MLIDAADIIGRTPEVRSIDAYAGAAAPFNFNGLVRHYYLRQRPELGDLQVTLAPRGDRHRSSHAIALDLRQQLQRLTSPGGTVVRVVEVPPGPPVISTLLAEIYGPDPQTRRKVASEVERIFHAVPYLVDIADSFGRPGPRPRLTPNREQMESSASPSAICWIRWPSRWAVRLSAICIAAKAATRSRFPCDCRNRAAPGRRAWQPCRLPRPKTVRASSNLANSSPRKPRPALIQSSGAMVTTPKW